MDYADDMSVMDGSADGLQESTDLLAHFAGFAGLRINSKKTKTMVISRDLTQRPYTEAGTVDITVEGVPVEQVSGFTYLGSVISADGTIEKAEHQDRQSAQCVQYVAQDLVTETSRKA